MNRIIDYFLQEWKHKKSRKSLLLRGARQVGKTHSVRKLGETYESFVEINFEDLPLVKNVFEKDFDCKRILRDLDLEFGFQIIPGKTLLFFDECQTAPQVIIALRYFYEKMPELHVIAAGSLLDFAIEQIGLPVGRVEALYMHPVSFIEYLAATNQNAVSYLLDYDQNQPQPENLHTKFLKEVAIYCAVGGMPHPLQSWIDDQNARQLNNNHESILMSYQQDIEKYSRKLQVKYVKSIFKQIPRQLAQKFKYSLVEGDFRKRELAPALDLLITAGVAHKITYCAGQGIPIGADTDDADYKVIFLDVGLTQAELGLDIVEWLLRPDQAFVNKGSLTEAFVGQELLTYAMPTRKQSLYYWHKESRSDQAEIDYLLQIQGAIIPVEVKAGTGRILQSLQYFMKTHSNTPYGLRFSQNNYSDFQNIKSYPLYAVAQVMSEHNPEMKAAILALIS
ncbi:ATP-binding protein [Candidatus Babeliales bacterium]|nr:ATP-binding protein [Candidatus Babeliales bacterium]MBP9843871.1 ATP-binding protein [Candidatus Babeliales bacterium]